MDDSHHPVELNPKQCPAVESEAAEVRRALAHPIGTPRLSEIVKPGEKVVIVASDVTRPAPSWVMVPCVVEELEKAGVKDEDITVVFGLGSHRKQTEEEKKRLVGEEIYSRIRCIDSDPEQCVHMGTCKMVHLWISLKLLRKQTVVFLREMWNIIISPVIPAA